MGSHVRQFAVPYSCPISDSDVIGILLLVLWNYCRRHESRMVYGMKAELGSRRYTHREANLRESGIPCTYSGNPSAPYWFSCYCCFALCAVSIAAARYPNVRRVDTNPEYFHLYQLSEQRRKIGINSSTKT